MHSIEAMNGKRKSNEIFIKKIQETEEKEVLMILDIETKQHFLKKVSKGNQRKVYQELQVLQSLQKINGIPEVRSSGISQNQNFYYTIDFYHLSLSDILTKAKQLCWQSVLSIGLVLLQILEEMHILGIIYQNLNPENVKLKPDEDQLSKTIKLIGFSKSLTKYKFQQPTLDQKNLEFKSRNYHKKGQPKLVDDLESLCYLLIKLKTGSLPWENASQEEMLRLKAKAFKDNELSLQLPRCLRFFLKIVDKQKMFPNYSMLRLLLQQNIQKCQSQNIEIKELLYLPQISEVSNEDNCSNFRSSLKETFSQLEFSSCFAQNSFDDVESDQTVEEKINLLQENKGKFKLLKDL